MSPRPLAAAERERLAAAQRVIQHAVATPRAPQDIERAQAEAYAELGLDPRDGEALAKQDTRRIQVYRKLVRSTLSGAIRAEIPRAAARLEGRFDELCRAFFEQVLPESQVLRDVAYEFAVWATPEIRRDDPALADLMRYELFEFDVYTARRRVEEVAVTDELAAEQRVAFCGTVRVGRFDYAVHELVDDPADRTEPEQRPTGLLAYRDATGRFRQLSLTPLATAILAKMVLEGRPLAPAVREACEAAGEAITPTVVEGTSNVIADLSERGAVLGGRDSEHPPPHPSPYARWLHDGASG